MSVMRLAWMSDLHMVPGFVTESVEQEFYRTITDSDADAFLVTGDFADAERLLPILRALCIHATERPFYFVLGNHDFYGGTIENVRHRAAALCLDLRADGREITYLSAPETFPSSSKDTGVVRLTADTVLVGHDGWGDGHAGAGIRTRVELNDFSQIGDLLSARAMAGKHGLFGMLSDLGAEAARHLAAVLGRAAVGAKHVVIATHVPPWVEAAWHERRHSDADWAPLFVCTAAGRVIERVAAEHPAIQFTVLCGHTHGAGSARIRDNLVAHTAGAVYGRPRIWDTLELA